MIENLKTLRNKYNVSQQKLAEAIGVSQQSVNKYENHSVEPDIAVLKKIADYFSVSIDYLTGRVSSPNSADISVTEEEKAVILGYRFLNCDEKEIVNLVIKNHR